MSLEAFLHEKRIDAEAFRRAQPAHFAALEALLAQAGKASFDQQKKFLFNPLRREYPLAVPAEAPGAAPPARRPLPLKKAAAPEPEAPPQPPADAPPPARKKPLLRTLPPDAPQRTE